VTIHLNIKYAKAIKGMEQNGLKVFALSVSEGLGKISIKFLVLRNSELTLQMNGIFDCQKSFQPSISHIILFLFENCSKIYRL